MLSFDKTEEEARLNSSSIASTPLKITFPLKNLFLLVQASSNLSITRLNFAFYFQVQGVTLKTLINRKKIISFISVLLTWVNWIKLNLLFDSSMLISFVGQKYQTLGLFQ